MWKVATYELRSSCPLLMKNGQTADPLNPFAKQLKELSAKRKKTDADYEELAHVEFLAGLYINKDGPFLPHLNIEATLLNAAKKSREGTLAKSCMFVNRDAQLEYKGPRTAEELWQDNTFRFSIPVVIQRVRILRTRPIFNEWKATISVNYENTLVNKSRVDTWIEVGGIQIGLCDWRPRYGRFEVKKL